LVGLIGDIGGTNARFAIGRYDNGEVSIDHLRVLQAADYPRGEDAVRAYLASLDPALKPRFGVIAAAGPIEAGEVSFTNNTAWRFSEASVVHVANLERARLINDFAAQALAIDHLRAEDCRTLGPEDLEGDLGATKAILGPGTGFGAGARVDDGKSRATLTGEAGHIAFAPVDEIEIEMLRRLTVRFGRVSIERLLSGPGLVHIYETLNAVNNVEAPPIEPLQITHRAMSGDVLCRAALSRFCAMLGSVAGDLALALGARGGVFITGGIAPDIYDYLRASAFRERFEAKGRMTPYLQRIPTRVVVRPDAALVGAASLLPDLETVA
jgi:glucokinase